MHENNKNILKLVVILLITIGHIAPNACAIIDFWNNSSLNQKRALKVIAGLSITAISYKVGHIIYTKIKNSIEAKIENEIADSIVLAATSNHKISKLPKEQKEEKLRKKAKLINARIRILNKLESDLNTGKLEISKNHELILKAKLIEAKAIFHWIDKIKNSAFCIPNPYEKDYIIAGFQESLIEDNIIKSIILATKPLDELTEQDKKIKKDKEIRKDRIINKIKHRISAVWLKKLEPVITLIINNIELKRI